jgi:putative intracellular protease/amidase
VEIAVLVYDGVDSAEALAPAQVLGRLPGARLWFVAADPGPKDSHNPPVHIEATHAVTHLRQPDAILVPGGFGCLQLIDDEGLVDWLRTAHLTSRWTLAVSTGPVLLGAAGLLRGRRTTGHWLTTDRLRADGAVPVTDRIVDIVDECGIVTANWRPGRSASRVPPPYVTSSRSIRVNPSTPPCRGRHRRRCAAGTTSCGVGPRPGPGVANGRDGRRGGSSSPRARAGSSSPTHRRP